MEIKIEKQECKVKNISESQTKHFNVILVAIVNNLKDFFF